MVHDARLMAGGPFFFVGLRLPTPFHLAPTQMSPSGIRIFERRIMPLNTKHNGRVALQTLIRGYLKLCVKLHVCFHERLQAKSALQIECLEM